MKRTIRQAAIVVLSALAGAAALDLYHLRDHERAYHRGRAAGLAECQKPSRLEKAAEWLAQ